ncbi:LANO_0G14400g1_1 [Lachancea nothofagi CBS 11611]|uniref:LANO_0G14400g1_1 n=1 Tax=Lachancea nothofagi CBS 11611 TaxID=1266666 RepID=A0A1G4KK66_9SACH|nr:LANO_0G14400g1_1 [Lachancea nothofagi CBS 11611]
MQNELSFENSSISSRRSAERHNIRHGTKLKPNVFVDHAASQWTRSRTEKEWLEKIFPNAAVYKGYDELLWGYFIVAVYKEPATGKLSSLIVDKMGTTHFNPVDISRQSRFYPAIENLSTRNQGSNVRKCVAVSLLQKFAELKPESVSKIQPDMKYDYDPTTAGDLANSCQLVGFCSPGDLGKSLSRLGFLQDRYIHSVLLDVVYENNEATIDTNNELVLHLGDQLEQLFNPLAEYSPEQTEIIYKPPEDETALEKDEHLISAICSELLQVQTNFTLALVEFLQKFLIPLRIEVSNEEINGLSIPKLNRLFPPTIDEVTRINCIFLDALKASTKHGSQEVLNACSITIPYFYKAYTRHEAATKNFSKDIKLFMAKFRNVIPSKDVYSEMKIETIIKSPQEIILKLKLILDRLWSNKKWEPQNLELAEARFFKIIDIISSFGTAEEPSASYNTRVFTPSGKLLTELAKGWPMELQYKWLKRRVVGVFDVMDTNDSTQKNILVIFSDYVVILNVIDSKSYYDSYAGKKPLLSDVLMNSLINEVPLSPNVPKLQVTDHFHIDRVAATTFGKDMIRIDSFEPDEAKSVAFKIVSLSSSASEVADLIVKAKILDKDTAFHLFRFTDNKLQIFSTAHEMIAYSMENMRSKFCLFLNIVPSSTFITDYDLAVAFFASLDEKGDVTITKLACDGAKKKSVIQRQNLAQFLVEELTSLYPDYYSTVRSPFFSQLLEINGQLVKKVGHHFNEEPDIKALDPNTNRSSTGDSQSLHSTSHSLRTLTTFRSSVSDVRQLGVTRNDQSVKARNLNLNPKVLKEKPSNTKVKGPEPKKKRQGFIGKIAILFGVKKKERASKTNPSRTSRTSGTNNSIPSVADNLNPKFSKEASTQRLSSVVHIPPSAKTTKNKIRGTPKNTVSKTHESKAIDIGDNDTLLSKNLKLTEGDKLSSCSSANMSAKRLPSVASQSIYYLSKSDRESQIFNHDLFGEAMVPDPKGDSQNAPTMQTARIAKSLPTEECHSTNAVPNENELGRLNVEATAFPEKVNSSLEGSFEELVSTVRDVNKDSSTQRQKYEPKPGIFPDIKMLTVNKSTFERSPSFKELFENMRLVLDDNDEPSNWKRLPSETSLKARKNAAEGNSSSHAFNSLASPKRPTAHFKLSNSQATINTLDHPMTYGTEEVSAVCPPLCSLAACTINESVEESQMKETRSNAGRSPINQQNRGSAFKVVNHSPSKIIGINSRPAPSKEDGLEDHLTRDSVEMPSPTVKSTKHKLFEMSNQSDDNIDDEMEFFTPLEVQNDKFVNRDQILSNHQVETKTTSILRHEERLSEIECAKESERLEPVYTPILDDPDFSSFHMTFDGNDETQESLNHEELLPMGSSGLQRQPTYQLEPVFYRLPAIEKSNDTFFTCSDENAGKNGQRGNFQPSLGEEQEEAIWISPSKLDMFDLSKLPDSVFFKIDPEKYRVINKKPHVKCPRPTIEDQPLLSDSSYAYLSSLLMNEDYSTKVGDDYEVADKKSGPTRLSFQN